MEIDHRLLDTALRKISSNIYRNDFRSFFKEVAFPTLFPNKELTPAKSTDIMCDIAQCFSEREKDFRRVIINIPPGLMKSAILSASLVAWHIGRNVSDKIFGVSNTDDLVLRNMSLIKDIIDSDIYKTIFPEIQSKKDTERKFRTVNNGEVTGFTTLGSITGQRCDMLITDDYISAKMLQSKALTKAALLAWDNSFYSRVDKINGSILIIEQRLGNHDLTGFLTRTCPDQYNIISLPIYFPEKKYYYINKKEYVFEENELLSPDRYNWDEVNMLRNRVVDDETGIANGKEVFFSQYMQDPIKSGGNLVDISWFGSYSLKDFNNNTYEIVVTSVDSAQKPNEINDPSAFLKFGILNENKYLGDHYCEKKVYPQTKEELINFCNRRPRTTHLLIEDANTGSSLIQELPLDSRMQGISIIAISHKGIKKEIRFVNATGSMGQGKTFFPKDAPWYPSFENELMQFPKIRHDDRADAYAQFEKWFSEYMYEMDFFCHVI